MYEISQSEKDNIVELVSSQKKAKLDWVATVTKTPIEAIIANAEDLGLIVEDEYISIPSGKKESLTDKEEVEYSSLQPKTNLKTRTIKSKGSVTGVVFMFIGAAFALLFGMAMIGVQACGWLTAIGVILLILGLGLIVGAIIILRKRK